MNNDILQQFLHFLQILYCLLCCAPGVLFRLQDWLSRWLEKGYSEVQIAVALKKDPRTIARWKSGDTKTPKVKTIMRMQKLDRGEIDMGSPINARNGIHDIEAPMLDGWRNR